MDTASPFKYDPSMTEQFKPLMSLTEGMPDRSSIKAVVLGGGTGSNLSIRTLLSMGLSVSAVVAMADDGGSTGILREEANVTPPGDVRKCLGAFAADQDDPLTHAFKYRFEFARNHTLGNLMLAALEDATGSFPEAIAICERLLNARGHVYPSTLDKVLLIALSSTGAQLVGQANASKSPSTLNRVWLTTEGLCHAYEGAVNAIREADFIFLGPGSLYTSVIPNILVPGIPEAIRESNAKTIFVCNLADCQGETLHMSARGHVKALLDHGMDGLLDYVILHSAGPVLPHDDVIQHPQKLGLTDILSVRVSQEDLQWIISLGIQPIVRNLYNPSKPVWHSPESLRSVFTEILNQCLSQQK